MCCFCCLLRWRVRQGRGSELGSTQSWLRQAMPPIMLSIGSAGPRLELESLMSREPIPRAAVSVSCWPGHERVQCSLKQKIKWKKGERDDFKNEIKLWSLVKGDHHLTFPWNLPSLRSLSSQDCFLVMIWWVVKPNTINPSLFLRFER